MRFCYWGQLILWLVDLNFAVCGVLTLPQNIASDALSETVPTAFAPNHWDAGDFELVWIGKPLQNVQASIGGKSLEWVRVQEILLIPRAQLVVQAVNIEAGNATCLGFSQSFAFEEKEDERHGTLHLPIALLSGKPNQIEIKVKRNGAISRGILEVKLNPKNYKQLDQAGSQVYRDPSCSRFGMHFDSKGDLPKEWLYVGCRFVYSQGPQYQSGILEVFILWSQVGDSIEIDGVETKEFSPSLWTLRLRQLPGKLTLRAKSHEVLFKYHIPDRQRFGNLGVGLGPYSYLFGIDTYEEKQTAPIVTLYGSYFIAEGIRLVAFNATSIASRLYSDLGIYLHTENFRIVDRRLGIFLLIGGHVIAVQSEGQFFLLLGAPQGFEIVVSDFFERGKNLSLGGFLYPSIGGKAYENIWIRWGGRTFIEINYLFWEDMIHAKRYFSRSLGLTIGFPLFSFL